MTTTELGASVRMREKPPRPTQVLNRKRIIAVASLGAVLLGWIFFESLSYGSGVPEPKKIKAYSLPPGELVQGLPSDYSALPRRKEKPVEASEVKAKAEVVSVSEEDEWGREVREKRKKSALLARESDVSFKGVPFERRVGGREIGDSTREPALSGEERREAAFNPRDEDNRQDDKEAFLRAKSSPGEVLMHGVRESLSPYQISAGTVIPGVLLTGINSDLPGQILGQVSQNVFDTVSGKFLLIPQGTKILGEYDSRVVYGQERVLIVWRRLIFPDGNSLNLEGMPGVDLSGYAGLSDQVNNHYGKLVTGVVMSSLLGAAAQVADGPTYQTFDPRYDQLAVQGAARELNQVGQQITRKNLNIQPTLEIRPGMRFNVFVSKDVVVKAYLR